MTATSWNVDIRNRPPGQSAAAGAAAKVSRDVSTDPITAGAIAKSEHGGSRVEVASHAVLAQNPGNIFAALDSGSVPKEKAHFRAHRPDLQRAEGVGFVPNIAF